MKIDTVAMTHSDLVAIECCDVIRQRHCTCVPVIHSSGISSHMVCVVCRSVKTVHSMRERVLFRLYGYDALNLPILSESEFTFAAAVAVTQKGSCPVKRVYYTFLSPHVTSFINLTLSEV